ncbi:MAG: hypothetical protein ABW321_29240 [Polyangiales bacterium]
MKRINQVGAPRSARSLGALLFVQAVAACGGAAEGGANTPQQPSAAGSTVGPVAPSTAGTSSPNPAGAAGAAATGVAGGQAGAMAAPSGGAAGVAPVTPSAGTVAPQPIAGAAAGSGGQAAAGSGGAATPAVLPAETVSITVPAVQPGEEDTQCVQIRLASTTPLSIVRVHNTLSAGSHHFILSALNDPNAAEQALTRCSGFGGSVTGAPLAITQAHDDSVVLPEGVGYRLEAGQVMHLEMHYINTGEGPLDITGKAELFAAPPGAQLQDGAVLLIGTADIDVAPRTQVETTPKFLALPAGMDGVKFYAITGHTHRFGTDVNVQLSGADQAPIMPLYTPLNYDWEAPETALLNPHVSVPAGGGFTLKCAWNNTGDTTLGWGESANAEMCFFWAYYYPRKKDVFSIIVDNIDQETLRMIAGLPPGSLP